MCTALSIPSCRLKVSAASVDLTTHQILLACQNNMHAFLLPPSKNTTWAPTLPFPSRLACEASENSRRDSSDFGPNVGKIIIDGMSFSLLIHFDARPRSAIVARILCSRRSLQRPDLV